MKLNNFFKLVLAIAVSELAGVVGALFTAPAISSWYAGLVKPALNPPSWVFGPVWTALYALMGISLFLAWKRNFEVKNEIRKYSGKAWNPWSDRLWRGDLQRINILAIFGFQLALNAVWSPVFFGLQNIELAFFVIVALWMAIVYTIVNFYRVSRTAAYLLMPYLLWVLFASYLNYAIWALN